MTSQNEKVDVDVLKILEQLGIDLQKSQQQCGIPTMETLSVNAAPRESS